MDFRTHLEKYLTAEEINELTNSFSEVSLRALLLNTNKACAHDIEQKFPFLIPHPIVKNGYIFDPTKYPLGKSIEHFLGLFYIQEPSAMVPAYLLNADKDDIVLDLCAAPGGKSVQTSFLMENLGLIIANDLSYSRTNAILENVERLGLGNIIITNNNFKDIYHSYKNYFTKIIVDAPCSGSGMFKKDKKMMEDWSYNKVLKFAEEQKEIISYAYKMLKPGGTLLYSTCSFSFEENEEVIEYLLSTSDAEVIDIEENDLFYVSKTKPLGIHLFPHIFPGDGQYICLIKKPGLLINRNENVYKDIYFGDFVFKTPNKFSVCKNLKIVRMGLKVGEKLKRKNEIIFDHHYSRFLKDFDKIYEVNEDVLGFILKGESITANLEKGFYLLTYQNSPICFAKSDGKILKNHLPKGLRRL